MNELRLGKPREGGPTLSINEPRLGEPSFPFTRRMQFPPTTTGRGPQKIARAAAEYKE
jgi:hypothetical protein